MKIVGAKIQGHNNSIFVIDLDKKGIFAISQEKITRIKHDNEIFFESVEQYKDLLQDTTYIVRSFEENELAPLRYFLFRRIIYQKFKPKYVKEFSKIENKIKKT